MLLRRSKTMSWPQVDRQIEMAILPQTLNSRLVDLLFFPSVQNTGSITLLFVLSAKIECTQCFLLNKCFAFPVMILRGNVLFNFCCENCYQGLGSQVHNLIHILLQSLKVFQVPKYSQSPYTFMPYHLQ